MPEKNHPTVSIVMATYNRAHHLEQTIPNIFEQNYTEIELLVVIDGSTDGTLEVLNRLKRLYDFIIINNEKNIGLQKSLNAGIRHASGKYIARIDDHDKWIDPDKIGKQVHFLESNSEIGIVGTAYQVGDKCVQNPLNDQEIRNQILFRSPFCHVSVLMVKSIVEKAGGYNESLRYSEDWELWLKMGRLSQMANLSEPMVSIQEEDVSLSEEYFIKQLPINRKIVYTYAKDYPKSNLAFFYHQFLRFFFMLFPLNGLVHRIMQRLFQTSFDLTSQRTAER